MATIEKSLELNAPLEQVWAVIADHTRMAEWAQMDSVIITSDETQGVGLTCQCDFGFFTADERVIEWQENHKIVHEIIAMGMPMKETWTLERNGGGTRFIWQQEVNPTGIRRLMLPMIKWQMGRTFDKALENLKAVVEGSSQIKQRSDQELSSSVVRRE